MREDLQKETEKLSRSWAQHDSGWLRDYLVAGVEDPRLNLHSVLTRHFLIRHLTGGRFESYMSHEYQFCAAAAWLTHNSGLLADPETRLAVLHALRQGSDNAEGIEIPQFLSSIFSALNHDSRVPHYLDSFLGSEATVNSIYDTFANLWPQLLGESSKRPVPEETDACAPGTGVKSTVIEAACGSANDFRFLHRYGISQLIAYTGFDLCSKNINNARTLFPEVRFEVANVFEIPVPDKAFELCVVHDLLEHLSLPGMAQAIQELCRVTRNGICVGFFQMEESAEHVVRPVDEYFWNLLSMSRTRQVFERQGFEAQVIHLDSFLNTQAPGAQTHNPNAYTFVLRSR